MAINIRYANDEDFQAVSKLIRKLFIRHAKIRPDLYKVPDFVLGKDEFKESVNHKFIIVAELENKIIAIIRFYKKLNKHNKDSHFRRTVFYVHGLYVEEKYRNQKIATQLINKLKEIAKKEEITAIELQVEIENTDAINFYKKNNFKESRIRMEFII